ncbi:gag-pol polyprotein [Tanacetum coccineum]
MAYLLPLDTAKHFNSLSLDESRSPDFNLFSNQEEYSEEEIAETMAETMEQYMSKTRADNGLGIARPKIEDKDSFELKSQFLKELRDNTFSGSDHEDANEHIKKVLEILDLFHIPNITIDQVMLRAFPMSLTGAASHWLRNKPSGSITTWEDLKIKFLSKYYPPAQMQEVVLFYNGLDVPTRQILNSRGAISSRTTADAKALTDAAIRNQGASIKTLEIQIGQMSKVLHERGFGSLPSSIEINLRDHVKSIATIIEADSYPICHMVSSQYVVSTRQNRTLIKEKDQGSFTLPCFINNVCFDNALADLGSSVRCKYPKGIVENVLVGIGKFIFPVDFIILDMPEDVKVPLILGRPFLSTAYAKIDVFKRKITLRVGDEKIIFKSVKLASSLIKRVYMLSLRERMELDLEARSMGETLVLNRSLDQLYGDYIELNDLNVPLEFRRDQVDDLMPTIKEGEVIDEPVIDIIKTRNNESFDKEFYNSIMRDEVEHKGKNVVGAFMNVPIFVRNFSVVTHFVVVENMDGYRDQDMGDIILGEPFCKASCVEARRFDGLITIHNGSDNVTYQMARSHPRFKHLSNAQCNKIKPLLKVSPYGVFQFMDTDLAGKEIDEVGEESIIWNPMCVL